MSLDHTIKDVQKKLTFPYNCRIHWFVRIGVFKLSLGEYKIHTDETRTKQRYLWAYVDLQLSWLERSNLSLKGHQFKPDKMQSMQTNPLVHNLHVRYTIRVIMSVVQGCCIELGVQQTLVMWVAQQHDAKRTLRRPEL